MALSSSLVALGVTVAVYGLLALGLNIKFGYNGLLDIGHVAFFLVGAYVTTLLVLPPARTQQFGTYILGWSWPWLPALLAGTIAAGAFGMLVALPAIRLREDYLAIAVLGISVVVKRVIQTETWMANGPDALKGWSDPLGGFFPLPPESVLAGGGLVEGALAALLFGIVVGVFWTVLTYALALLYDGPPETTRGRIVHGLLAVTSLGAGYLVARRVEDPDSPWTAGVGLVFGLVATLAAAVGLGELAALVLLGAASLQSWMLGGIVVARHYADVPRRDVVAAFGLAVAFVAAFVPVIVLGGATVSPSVVEAVLLFFAVAFVALFAVGALLDDYYGERPGGGVLGGLAVAVALVATAVPVVVGQVAPGAERMSSIGLLWTVALLVAYLYGIYYLGYNWSRFSAGGGFVSVVGVGAIWLFVLRYFVLSLVAQFKATGVDGATLELIQNVVWLIQFRNGIQFGYTRFLFALTVVVLLGAYYLTEVTTKSPFGRVLKAIREDEDVALALGKDTFSFKVQSMILGSALAGLAGGFWAIKIGALNHEMFQPRITFIVFLMVIIGGTANNRGVILGAVIYWAFQKGTEDIAGFFPTTARTSVQALRLAFIGALLIVILYYRPEGIWGEERMATTEGEQ